MSFSRYSVDARLAAGTQMGTARAVKAIRSALLDGSLPLVQKINTTGFDRLDTLAGIFYGDSRYWWVLAAASDIGWGLQVPAGIVINVPDLRFVERLIG